MPTRTVESQMSDIETTSIEEFLELAQKGMRKFHSPAIFERVGEYSTGSEEKSDRYFRIRPYSLAHEMMDYWIQYEPKSRERDYIPINLATSIKELGKNLVEIKSYLEEINQRLEETPNKWITHIHDLGDEDYKLIEPILILIEEYPNDTVIARFPEVETFGEGINDSEAMLSLKNSILDLYDELTETDPDVLGRLPKMWLRILDKIIVKT